MLSGVLLWADSLASFNPRTPLERLGDIRAFAATDKKNAYFISQSGRMSAFEVNSGIELWAKPLSGIEMPWIVENTIFVVHTAYPRFLINVINDEILWMEEFEKEDSEELESQITQLIDEALSYYDKEIKNFE